MGPFQTIFCIVLISECIAGIGALFSSFQRATDTKTKIVAVTGATGLVGAPLVKALKSKDVKVRVLTTRKGMDDPENGIWTWSPGTSGFITSEVCSSFGYPIYSFSYGTRTFVIGNHIWGARASGSGSIRRL